jgi:hypothetical protein
VQEEKTKRQNFLRVLEAIIEREQRQYARPQLDIWDDEQLNDARRITVVRKQMREDDVVNYCRYEAHVLRPTSNAAGIFTSSEERYKKHRAAVSTHQPYYIMIEEMRNAKRARREARAEGADRDPESFPEDFTDEPDDQGAASGGRDFEDDDAAADDEGVDGDGDGDGAEWVANTIRGDAPTNSWEDYLTYGVAITTTRNDRYLKLYKNYMEALASGETRAAKDIARQLKHQRSLICDMTKKTVKETFR